jgi:hypothetical protein
LRFPALVPALLACLAACGPRGGVTEPVPDETFDPAPWESAWSPAEISAWREGVVMDLTRGGDTGDEKFAPGAGALVELFAVSPDGKISPAPIAAMTTGPDGTFRVGPGPENGWILKMSRPDTTTTWVGGGLGLSFRGVVMPPPGKSIRLGMRAAHDLAGRVVDPAGKPVAGAHLTFSGEAHRDETTTDADGRFALRPPRGAVVVELDDKRFETAHAMAFIPETGQAPDVSIVARPATPLSGWVQNRDGVRLSGVAVFGVDDPRNRARTDAQGRFSLATDRRVRVAAVADGYGWRTCVPPVAGELEIILDAAEGVVGRVVDADGRPVPDARLSAVVHGYAGVLEHVLGPRTASDGSFRFSWLPKPWRGATTPAWFLARKRGVGESAIQTNGGAGKVDASNAKLVIAGVRDVVGRVKRADGRPIADALIEARWGHWDGGITQSEVAVLGLNEAAFARSDADGRWRIPAVPLELRAKIRCGAEGIVLERTLDSVPAGAPFDFEFESGRDIAGKVVAPDGSPVEGDIDIRAQLLMAQGTEADRSMRAARDGSFRFEDLPSGEYQLTAWGAKYDLSGVLLVKAGAEAVEVRMHKTATLKFAFAFDAGGPPAEPLSLKLEPYGGGAVVHRRTLKSEEFGAGVELSGVTPGAWTLAVSCGLWRAGIDRLDVIDGESRTIDVPLVRTLRVAARLLAPDGGPRASTQVVISPVPPTKGAVVWATSAGDGTLDLTGLLPGKWLASVDAPGAAAMRTEFVLAAESNEPLVLKMPPHGAIVVRVPPEEAKGVEVSLCDDAGAPVLAWADGAATSMSQFNVDSEGRATLRGVRVGKVKVNVRVSGSSPRPFEVVVAAGRESLVEVK